MDVTDSLKSPAHKATGRLPFWELIERTRAVMDRELVDISEIENTGTGKLLICGGGPSLHDTLKTIRKMSKKSKVLGCNKTHDWLLKKGIKPDYACLLDPKDWVADYIKKPHKNCTYLIANQCHPDVFDSLADFNVVLWHAGEDYYNEEWPTKILKQEYQDRIWKVVPGATTVGLRAILVGYLLGYRDFQLFGFDSSLNKDGQAHAYAKPKPPDAKEGQMALQSKIGTEVFTTNSHMAKQCTDFVEMVEKIGDFMERRIFEPVNITVHGSGLLPSLAAGYGLHADKNMNLRWCGKEAA